jgi:hypothetical protein
LPKKDIIKVSAIPHFVQASKLDKLALRGFSYLCTRSCCPFSVSAPFFLGRAFSAALIDTGDTRARQSDLAGVELLRLSGYNSRAPSKKKAEAEARGRAAHAKKIPGAEGK